jgi:hypothetical protein
MGEPDAFACDVNVSSDVIGVAPGTPLGSSSSGRMTGGCGETPQPPAVNGNRFAIGDLGDSARARHRDGRMTSRPPGSTFWA